MERGCVEFVESVKNVQRSCDTGTLSEPERFHPEDHAMKFILSFINEAQKKAKNLSGLFEATIKTEFDGVMRYFGEDPIDKSARAAFFRRFSDFLTQYQSVKKENMEREEARKKEESRKKVLGTANKPGSPRDPKTVEANNKIMDDLLDKLRGAPKDSARHQRRRAARRNVSGPYRSSLRSASASSLAASAISDVSAEVSEPVVSIPPVNVMAAENGDDGELDLGAVAQGLLAGLKGGDDLLASFREARKSVNVAMNEEASARLESSSLTDEPIESSAPEAAAEEASTNKKEEE